MMPPQVAQPWGAEKDSKVTACRMKINIKSVLICTALLLLLQYCLIFNYAPYRDVGKQRFLKVSVPKTIFYFTTHPHLLIKVNVFQFLGAFKLNINACVLVHSNILCGGGPLWPFPALLKWQWVWERCWLEPVGTESASVEAMAADTVDRPASQEVDRHWSHSPPPLDDAHALVFSLYLSKLCIPPSHFPCK